MKKITPLILFLFPVIVLSQVVKKADYFPDISSTGLATKFDFKAIDYGSDLRTEIISVKSDPGNSTFGS